MCQHMIIDHTKFNGNSGVYVSAIPVDTDIVYIKNLVSKLDPDFSLDKFYDEAHMTIVYSRDSTISIKDINIDEKEFVGLCYKFEYWSGHDSSGYVVLRLFCKSASDVHNHILDIGAEHSFASYDPHITICDECSTNESDILKWIDKANTFIDKNQFVIRFNKINIEDCNQD